MKTRHFPGCWSLGRKDNLWKNFSRMKRSFGKDYDFCPQTYLLPDDYRRFQSDRENDPKGLWIVKPMASSQGKGIRVISANSELKKKKGLLISKYLSKPHLINECKYDLRIYVCVTCFDPLRIYIYDNGLVRLATEKYTTAKSKIKKKYVHLTNYSIQKKAAGYNK